jgi:ligand-binding sensor domain-containing protein/signal transduction histidine kinase
VCQARSKAKTALVCLALWLGFAMPTEVRAERLPLKTYTTADGLARDYISRIVLDSHGFLWFCTPEGLSRFDGYAFTNYGAADGLRRSVRDLLQARDGAYWIATASGLYRFDPGASKPIGPAPNNQPSSLTKSVAGARAPKFVFYGPGDNERARSVNIVKEDRSGVIWCGTDAGLYRLDQAQGGWSFSFVDIGLPTSRPDDTMISAILEDRRGSLWIGAGSGLYRRLPDGGVERYTTQHGLPFNDVRALLEDRDGRLWVGTTLGLCQLLPESDSRRVAVAHTYTTKDGLAHNWITSLLQTTDGRLWAGTAGGLSEWAPDAAQRGQVFRSYTRLQGLSVNDLVSLAEDADGDLWIGTESGGAMRVARNGFSTYTEAEGLGDTRIASIFEDRAGELCVISGRSGALFIHRFDERGFTVTRPNPSRRINYGWGWNQIAFQDSAGEWWVPTSAGLYRFPRASHVEQLGHLRPRAIYTTRDGLSGDVIFRLYEDSRGDIWITSIGPNPASITRWERATGRFQRYGEANGLPSNNGPTCYREDRSGNLWIGFYEGVLARYRDGVFKGLSAKDGLPEGMIRDLHIDHSGKLWIATSRGGVARIDDLAAEHPRFVTYTTAQGLASNQATCLTEDQRGRMYIGTPQGVDRLDSSSGHIKHYTVADGLANNFVNVAYRDRQGALWFGTLQGLSRLLPEPDVTPRAPSILISGLRIAGEDYAVSPLGQAEVVAPDLDANQNDLQIDFSSVSVSAAASLRYQYKLEGADHDWSAPGEQRSITYARLSPGSYRFQVRAVNVDGVTSAQPAFVSFTILRPIWQRWWFVTLAVLLAAGTAATLYKYRVNRLLELERVRTRIATDLHDDIGASLSRMAILSEVVKLQSDGHNERSTRMLTDISDSARSLVDSMSDIVWSIDPRRDDLQSVVRRLRQFAADLLEAQGIKWNLQAAPELEQVKLKPEQRRDLFLIFKEALTNIARHAGCTSVLLRLTIAGHQLRAEINDDGSGFLAVSTSEPGANGRGGHGVENMRARAAQLGGRLEINSTPGAGTRLTLTMPLAEQHGMNMLFSRWWK